MGELKGNEKKIAYWVTIGAILIIVYKILDQLPSVTEAIGTFFEALAPIISGVFIAYILYLPCNKIEKLYKKAKTKVIKEKARTLSIATIYILL